MEQFSIVRTKNVVKQYDKKVEPGICKSGNKEGEHCGEGHGQCAPGLTCIKRQVVQKITNLKNKRKEEHEIKKLKKAICTPEFKEKGKSHDWNLKQKTFKLKFQLEI